MLTKTSLAVFFSVCTAIGLANDEPRPATQSLRVLTYNLGWMVSASEFAETVQFCSRQTEPWCDARNERAVKAGCQNPRDGLPPCSAYVEYHNDASLPQPAAVFHPTLTYQRARVRAIAQQIAQLNPQVVALQEISGEAAVRELLAESRLATRYAFCVSEQPPGLPAQTQKLAFLWETARFTPDATPCRTRHEIAVREQQKPDQEGPRGVRPLLVLSGSLGGVKLALANLHLKSSCANPLKTPRFAASFLDDANPHCLTLRKQLPRLELVLEELAAAHEKLIVLGDFNRDIATEQTLSSELGPRQGRTQQPLDKDDRSTPIRLLWQEVADGAPENTAFEIVPLDAASKDERQCPFQGLDHIVLSKKLAQHVRSVNGGMPAVARKAAAYRFPGAGSPLPASDHCPQFADMSL